MMVAGEAPGATERVLWHWDDQGITVQWRNFGVWALQGGWAWRYTVTESLRHRERSQVGFLSLLGLGKS